jgi:hypothetical protein
MLTSAAEPALPVPHFLSASCQPSIRAPAFLQNIRTVPNGRRDRQRFVADLLISLATSHRYSYGLASKPIQLATETGYWTETRGKMASGSDRSHSELSHFHACVHPLFGS